MPRRNIIGLVGPSGSGKTTIGNILSVDYDFGVAAFAAPLKRMLCALVGEFVTSDQEAEALVQGMKDEGGPVFAGLTARQLLQSLGTQWGTQLLKSKTTWTVPVFQVIDSPDNMARDFVVTDVRFNYEAEEIRSRGGFIVRVDALGKAWQKNHESEFGHTIRSDATIVNDLRSLNALGASIHRTLQALDPSRDDWQ